MLAGATMPKRKYDQYGEDQYLSSKHTRSKHFSNGRRTSNESNGELTTDSQNSPDSKNDANRDDNALYPSDRVMGVTESGERSNKIATLLEALDDFILFESGGIGQPSMVIERDTLSQCKALRKVLRKQRNLVSLDSTSITTVTPATRTNNTGYIVEQPLQIPSTVSLTPWKPASILKNLPALPEIKSLKLETAAFTHSGMTSHGSDLSYERLEWLGDAYLQLIATILISSTFTTHTPGKCTQIREILVKNETLASYARNYGFEKRARLPPEFSDSRVKGFRARETEKVKVMGDIFEAYVAAVILSDPEQGINRLSAWLKSLWAQTISTQIRQEDRMNERAKAIAAGDANESLNPKDALSKKIGIKGVQITYKDEGPILKDRETGFPLFTVGAYLDGWGEQNKLLGTGRALGKKDAGRKAAEMALADKKLMALYGEMKQVHDEKLKADKERAALAGEGSSQTVAARTSPGAG